MPAGVASKALYVVEASFAAGGTCNLLFGHGVKIGNVSRQNALKPIYGLGNPEATAMCEGVFSGAFSIDFEATGDAKWMRALMGTYANTPGAPDLHTFTAGALPDTLAIQVTTELGATDTDVTYKGCVVTEAKFTAEVGDSPFHVALTIIYATETKGTTAYTAPSAPSDGVWNFAQATWTVSGSTVATTERVEISIAHDGKMIPGLGSRIAPAKINGPIHYSVRTVNFFTNPVVYQEKFYGSATAPNATVAALSGLVLTVTNSLAGDNMRAWAFTFTGAYVDSHSQAFQVDDAIMEEVEIKALGLSIVVSNASATY
jgi:hypothetical protein